MAEEPRRQPILDSLKTHRRYLTDGSQKYTCLHDRKPPHADNTVGLQAAHREVLIVRTQKLIEVRDEVFYLRRDHAHEPIVVFTGQFAEQECGTEFSFFKIRLRKPKEYDLPGAHF